MFLDASGSSPMTNRALEAFQAGLADGWADPTRLHSESRRARQLLDGSREAIADALDARPEQVHLTASPHLGLERVIAGVFAARRGRGRIVASAVERDATLHAADYVSGGRLATVPVDRDGHVDIEALGAELADPDVALAAVQHGNHEIGTLQRLDRVHAATSAAAVPLIVDATASIGHVPAPERWDALVANPADWGGPQGIGVVALRPSTRWLPVWPEGDDWAPGGVSVPAALAAAVALQERLEQLDAVGARLGALIDHVRARATDWPGVDVVGDPAERLPHVVTFSCLYVDGEALLTRLDREGIAVGSGSACTTSTLEPSRVLASIGALSHGNVRLGLHPGVGEADIERFLALMPRILGDLRDEAGAPDLG
ncbi:aminotransferase class V-fold PLP-dependent enzyme [Demequina sp. SYSU T00039]|uniref:Aminotransferase class V-fold PLP-dependent enzyme n=1 Tax=Demequina lignilytica TaxID=3051663 RepID=A0AAW7M3C0_9MICO|nr:MULTISPECIES: aminotransferase class V-fold PLP-dependent enzyme [unclassified Demequina]MDN4486827.1 aminotransferase class V-fold PLP-dependent enzyme [Demequina sp. SYSU T00039]MDN4489511.1 aminotransferase class V-fold PLP-dependent enzyme [Demequina sp. SYSU T00068]